MAKALALQKTKFYTRTPHISSSSCPFDSKERGQQNTPYRAMSARFMHSFDSLQIIFRKLNGLCRSCTPESQHKHNQSGEPERIYRPCNLPHRIKMRNSIWKVDEFNSMMNSIRKVQTNLSGKMYHESHEPDVVVVGRGHQSSRSCRHTSRSANRQIVKLTLEKIS